MSSLHKPKYTQSILEKLVGTAAMPAELLDKLFKENTSAWGLAVRTSKGIEIEKFAKMGDASSEIKEFEGILKGTKNYPSIAVFHSFPKEFDEDEIQPWAPIKDSKGMPILAVAIDGDLPKYAGSEDGNSEAMEFLLKWLGPKLEQAYAMAGNSPSKLYEFVKSAQFMTDFSEQIGHRCVLTFMPAQGDPFCVEKNEIGDSGVYGNVSNSYGFSSPKPEPAPKPEVKPKAEAEPEAPKKSKWADEDTPEPVKEVPSVPGVAPPALPKDDVTGKVAKEIVEQDWTPPPNIHGKKLKNLYREMLGGTLPANWDERPTVKIKVEKVVKSLAEIGKLNNGTGTTVDDKGIYTMPILSGEKLKAINEMITKHLGDGSAVISDPKDTAEEIKKLAKFTDVVKGFKDLDALDRVRTSFLFAVGKQHPEAIVLALIQMREDRRQLKAMLDQVTAPGEQKPITTEPVIPEVIPSPEPERKVASGGKNKYL